MSNEKQFENFENKLKKALESGEHAFNEGAWARMEALLDKEGKRRRPLIWFWLLPLLLIGTVAVIKFSGNSSSTDSKNSIPTVIEKSNAIKEKKSEEIREKKTFKAEEKLGVNDNKLDLKDNDESGEEKKEVAVSVTKASDKVKELNTANTKRAPRVSLIAPITTLPTASSSNKNRSKNGKSRTVISGSDITTNERKSTHERKSKGKGQSNQVKNNGSFSGDTATPSVEEEPANDSVTKVPDVVSSDLPRQPASLQQLKDTVAKETNAQAANKKVVTTQKHREFYLVGSLAADAGSVKLLSFKNSTIVAKYGLAAGYKFSRKFSVQTGFFLSSKKYTAAGENYQVKPGSYWSMHKITSVDAICKVYDIPLSLRYDIANKGSLSYYAMAGVSSYIMKKEDYDYYYMNWGTLVEKSNGYTGNKHLFSNADISFGIEKKLSKLFSLQLEPSISIPIKGVGDGKIKLYSTSIMFGLKYLPFKK